MLLTLEIHSAIVCGMNNTELAKNIGISRQMLEATVCGKRNFGYKAAKQATQVLGGTLDVWQDSNFAQMRMSLLEAFKEKTGGKK